DVDRDSRPTRGKLPRLLRGARQGPRARFDDHARVFHDWYETRGRDQAPARTMPPHEGFEAGERAGANLDFGLVVQQEFAVAHRPAHLRFELETFLDPRGGLRSVQLV